LKLRPAHLLIPLLLAAGCNHGNPVVNVPNRCEILDGSYDDSTPNPANECQVCNYGSNIFGWTAQPDGTPCSGGVCINQLCQAGCIVGGVAVPEGKDPANSCRACVPATSTTDWTYSPDMAPCSPDGGAGAFCVAGQCSGCLTATQVCSNGAACCSRLCDGQRCYDQSLGGICEDDRSCATGNHCSPGTGVCCSPNVGVECQNDDWCCAPALHCQVNMGSAIGTCQ